MHPSRPLRVLQLGGPMGLYGAERWILALARNSSVADVEFVIGVLKDAPGGEPELTAAARAAGLPTAVFEAHGRTSRAAIGQLRCFLRERQIDVLHTHGYKTDLVGAIAARGTGCTLLTTPHGWSVRAGLKLQIYEALDRIAFIRFDAVAPLSQDLYDGLARLPWVKSRLTLIPNGVDLTELDAEVAAKPRPARERGRVVGYVGQLIARKGLSTLLRAAADLPDVELTIVGEGPQRAEFERQAADLGISGRVRFTGFRSDRIKLMLDFDLFVLPSELEGIPRCLMESMAIGVPVAASDIPGCRALVEPGITGELFGVGDVDALRTTIAAMLGDPTRTASLAAAARDRVRRDFSAETMSRRYLELYRRVVATRSATSRAAA